MSFLSSLFSAARSAGSSALRGLGTAARSELGRELGRQAVSQLASNIQHVMLSPATREGHYQANRLSANQIVTPDQVIRLWYADRLERSETDLLLAWNGVWWNGEPEGWHTTSDKAWWHLVDLERPRPPWEVLSTWYRINNYGRDTGIGWGARALDLLKRQGIYDPAERDAILHVPELLSAEAVLSLWKQGQLTRDQAERWLQKLGWFEDADRQALFRLSEVMGLSDVATALYRGLIDQGAADLYLQAAGWIDPGQRRVALELEQEIPTATDIVSMATRLIWTRDLVERFGYDQEYPPELDDWLLKNGLLPGRDVPLPDQPGRQAHEIPLWYWRAHWRPFSMSEAFLAYQRFRPERVARYRALRDEEGNPLLPDFREFTWGDLVQHFRLAGYPPPLRSQLAALAFAIPRIRDISDANFYRLDSRQQTLTRWKDRGYLPDDAEWLTDLTERRSDYRRNQERRRLETRARAEATRQIQQRIAGRRWTFSEGVEQLTELGLSDDIARQLANLALTQPGVRLHATLYQQQLRTHVRQTLQAQRDGLIGEDAAGTQLIEAGIAAPLAVQLARQVEVDAKLRQVQEATRAVRSEYLHGVVTKDRAQELLQLAGLQAVRAAQLVQQWGLLLTSRRRQLSTQKVLALYVQGLLTEAEAGARLSNLGWDRPDLVLLLEEAHERLTRLQAREERAGRRRETAQRREQLRLRAEALRVADDALRRARQATNFQGMRRDVDSGKMGQDAALAALEALGFSKDEALGILGGGNGQQ